MDNHSPSMAPAAASFLSTCGSERGPPECSTQRSPTPTPQVGHGTDNNCSGVSSFFFTRTECKNARRKTVQFGTLLELAVPHLLGRDFSVRRQGELVVQDHTQKRCVDLKAAVVLYEPKLSEFVHEEIDS
jgi:hypothetical protein